MSQSPPALSRNCGDLYCGTRMLHHYIPCGYPVVCVFLWKPRYMKSVQHLFLVAVCEPSIHSSIHTHTHIYIYLFIYDRSAFHSMAPYGGPLILLLLWSCWGWLLLGPRCFTAQITNMSSVVPSSSAPRSFTLPQCGTCPSIILRMQTSFLFRIGLEIWNLEFSCLRVSF